MTKGISESVFWGIWEAVWQYEPLLAPSIYKLLPEGGAPAPSRVPGNATGGRLEGSISWEAGEPILRALELIQNNLGREKTFAGWQISFLIEEWRRFAAPASLEEG